MHTMPFAANTTGFPLEGAVPSRTEPRTAEALGELFVGAYSMWVIECNRTHLNTSRSRPLLDVESCDPVLRAFSEMEITDAERDLEILSDCPGCLGESVAGDPTR